MRLVVSLLVLLCGCDASCGLSPRVAAPDASPAQPSPAAAPFSVEEACGQMIVVAWKGAQYAPANVERDESDARTRAEALLAQAERGDDFAFLAATQSDGERTRERGGVFGTFSKAEFPSTYAELKEPLFRLHPGQIGELVHTQFGWVVLRRCAVEKITLRHILIRYQGAVNAPPELTRTRDAAMAIATALRTQVNQDPSLFESLARTHSEDAFAARGGEVGAVAKGRLEPTYENIAFSLEPGELSPAFETDAGFYVVQRMP